jgi:hypothetical protein
LITPLGYLKKKTLCFWLFKLNLQQTAYQIRKIMVLNEKNHLKLEIVNLYLRILKRRMIWHNVGRFLFKGNIDHHASA